jgi:hypothetical protein
LPGEHHIVQTRAYLQRPLNAALVLGSFFILTLPLVAFGWGFATGDDGDLAALMRTLPVQAYVALFGISHFFVTFTVYFHRDNRAHFASTPGRRAVFYVVPAAVLVGIALYTGLGLARQFAGVTALLFVTIRAFDFFHLNRQSFGVLQLFKGSGGGRLAPWVRRVENAYFVAWAALLLVTFLQPGMRFAATPPSLALVSLIALGGLTIVTAYARAWRSGASGRDIALALGYWAAQTAAVALAVVWIGFYTFALAVHYVEYHVLMRPRWSRTPLVADAVPDRLFAPLRARPVFLYAVLFGLGALYVALREAGLEPRPQPMNLLVHVFDGLFLFHYFVEMHLWKFREPYFRNSLAHLYFPRAAS